MKQEPLPSELTRDSIETAYAFLHQKMRVYIHSTMDWQRDDIEYAIGTYADEMNPELYKILAGGRTDYLRDHRLFEQDITHAVRVMEQMLGI